MNKKTSPCDTFVSTLDSSLIAIRKKSDFELSERERSRLLSFPRYFEDRIFHKQIPSFRFFATYKGEIIGQVSLVYRAISINKQYLTILGVEDLCVLEKYRRQGVASLLMQEVERIAHHYRIDHILLFSDEKYFYAKLGYKEVDANCRWLAIEDSASLLIMEKNVKDILMIKSQTHFPFEGQTIDLLGHLF